MRGPLNCRLPSRCSSPHRALYLAQHMVMKRSSSQFVHVLFRASFALSLSFLNLHSRLQHGRKARHLSGKKSKHWNTNAALTHALQSFSEIISESDIIQSGEHTTACCPVQKFGPDTLPRAHCKPSPSTGMYPSLLSDQDCQW